MKPFKNNPVVTIIAILILVVMVIIVFNVTFIIFIVVIMSSILKRILSKIFWNVNKRNLESLNGYKFRSITLVYQNLRPEIGEKLLQQGITSLDQLSQRKNPPKETIIERKIVQKTPIKPKRVIYPVPVYHYVPYFRHSVSHHINENHRHYFY